MKTFDPRTDVAKRGVGAGEGLAVADATAWTVARRTAATIVDDHYPWCSAS